MNILDFLWKLPILPTLGQIKLIAGLVGLPKKFDAGRGFFILFFMTKNLDAVLILLTFSACRSNTIPLGSYQVDRCYE